MFLTPSDHFMLHEKLISTASELKQYIDDVSTIARESGCRIYWRGQSDHRWGVLSSLSRLVQSSTGLTNRVLRSAELDLLAESKRWVSAIPSQPQSELEWLAVLQHHGIPTRLVDFTTDPLKALFFAVESANSVQGRLFGVAVPEEMVLEEERVGDFAIDSLEIGQLRMWQPSRALTPRLVAQDGAFAIGRHPSTTPVRQIQDSLLDRRRLLLRSEIVSIFSIPLYLVDLAAGRNRSNEKYPSCFTAKIHVEKSSIRAQLARKVGRGALKPTSQVIDHASCYPDLDGLRQHSTVVQRIAGGIG